MQEPRWRDHWIFKVLSAMCAAYAGIYTIAYSWKPTTWYGVFFVICGLVMLYVGLDEIYKLIKKARND
jgi:hypothetical protein